MQFREIAKARRAPLKEIDYVPISQDEWNMGQGGGQKLIPYLLHNDKDGLKFGPVDDWIAWATKEREDDTPDGRVYRLRLSNLIRPLGAHKSQQILPLFPSNETFHKMFMWATPHTQRVEVGSALELAFPSVTTVLDQVVDGQTDLDAWRESVGHAEADRIAAESALKGQHVHDICEWYTTKRGIPAYDQYTEEEWTIFHLLRQHIDKQKVVCGSELTVFHTVLGYSGTIDLLCWEGDDNYTLIDFKTYRRFRKPEHLIKAKLQVTMYAMALRDCYGINVRKAQIIYANPDTGLQVVDFDLDEWYHEAEETVRKYYALRS